MRHFSLLLPLLELPRLPSFPDTCDEIKRLELSFLRQKGLLKPGDWSLTIRWTERGAPTGSIGLESHIAPDGNGYLRLLYGTSEAQHDYRITLTMVASNLPKSTGQRYYMVCPDTGLRATVLYLHEETQRFGHRQAAGQRQRLYYDSQLEPKRFRGLTKYFAVDRTWEREYRKGRKTTYRGKPTKWYASLLTLEGRAARAAAPAIRALAKARPG